MAEISVTLMLPGVEDVGQIIGLVVLSNDPCEHDHGIGVIKRHTHPAICIQTNLELWPGWDAERIAEKVRKLLGELQEQEAGGSGDISKMKPHGKVS